MTELPTPSKLAKWKRPLIGGLLTGFVAVAMIYIASIFGGRGSVLILILTGFHLPMFIYQIFLTVGDFGDFSETVGLILLPFLFWFLTGAAIVHFSRKIMFAIGWLLLLEIVFTVIIIGYFFLNPVCTMC